MTWLPLRAAVSTRVRISSLPVANGFSSRRWYPAFSSGTEVGT